MDNELYTICELLNSWDETKRFKILKAENTENGLWNLTIKKIEAPKDQEAKNEAV